MWWIVLLMIGLSGYAQAAPVPDCVLTTLDGGESRQLREIQQGKVVYVDFWASWCTSCAQAFKFLNAVESDLRDRGFAVIGVNLDENRADAVNFLERFPPRFTVLADAEAQCAKAFGVQGMPASYLIDRTGEVRYRHLGFRSGDADELRRAIEELVAESPPDG
ncbi:MAG: TlpA family protein disulfide reductase [Methylohalobius sp. ZOD2]|nr:TlpA family protein disulfide reductase [Methylothermaceae bacterium]